MQIRAIQAIVPLDTGTSPDEEEDPPNSRIWASIEVEAGYYNGESVIHLRVGSPGVFAGDSALVLLSRADAKKLLDELVRLCNYHWPVVGPEEGRTGTVPIRVRVPK